jgi:KUP system potassium uptake protein
MASNLEGVPNALVQYFGGAKTLHQQIVLLTVQTRHVPEVKERERVCDVVDLGEGFVWVKAAYGFMETPDVPSVISLLRERGLVASAHKLSYFLGRESLVFTGASKMSFVRKLFFRFLSQNAVPAWAFFKLPPGQVVELGVQLEI